ncbi:MAG: TfoX/Sxy family protein [Bacteroidales bacterium]|jgi:TfoX/Sxy family transcriptional regulator of competence genes
MAYDHHLANKVRELLVDVPRIEEKEMMGGLLFMVDDKMCVGIIKDELMCRIDPGLHETLVEKTGCRTMDFTKRPMIGYVLIDESGLQTPLDFSFWLGLALDFNKRAKSSRKKPKS